MLLRGVNSRIDVHFLCYFRCKVRQSDFFISRFTFWKILFLQGACFPPVSDNAPRIGIPISLVFLFVRYKLRFRLGVLYLSTRTVLVSRKSWSLAATKERDLLA